MKTLSFITLQRQKIKSMKKFTIILGMFISFHSTIVCAQQTIHQAYVQKSNTTIGNKPHRAPIVLPSVEVIYDSEAHSISVLCSDESSASVQIYDMYGNLIDSSNSLDSVLYIPKTSNVEYIVRIISDNWYAIAYIWP